jgi:hypothetical protein
MGIRDRGFDPILMYTLKEEEKTSWRPERYEIIYGIHDRSNGRYMGSTMESLVRSCSEYYDMTVNETFLKLTESVTEFIQRRLDPDDRTYSYFVNKLEEWYRDRVRQYFNILAEELDNPVDTDIPASEIDIREEEARQEMFNLWIRGYTDEEIAEELERSPEEITSWRGGMRLESHG